LEKYTILIGKQSQVYGVLGVQDSLADILGARPLPIMVEAVLLPFKGQIIYDGLLNVYNVSFGSGVRSELHETYMMAKQNARIITTLVIFVFVFLLFVGFVVCWGRTKLRYLFFE